MLESDNPYDRMRLVLERGWLRAFRAPTGDVGEEAIPPGQWIALLRRLTRIPGNSASSGGPGSKTVPGRLLEEESEILFPRAQVIDAETRISREEFEWRLWTIAQIVGWLAYRNESQFRSLEQADLIGRAYHGLTYARDFENDIIDSRLAELLLSSRIKGYQDGKEIGVGEFTRITTVWELSDIKLVRPRRYIDSSTCNSRPGSTRRFLWQYIRRQRSVYSGKAIIVAACKAGSQIGSTREHSEKNEVRL
jgi:hypothetical protein